MRYYFKGYDRNKKIQKNYIDAENRKDALQKIKDNHEITIITKLKESKEIPIVEKTKNKINNLKEERQKKLKTVKLSQDNLNYLIEQSTKTGGLFESLTRNDELYFDNTQKPKIDKRKELRAERKSERSINWDSLKVDISKRNKKAIKVKPKDLIIFTSQLATMINSGVSLIKSLKILEERTKSKKFREVIADINTEVQKGNQLSQAMAKYPTVFDFVYTAMIQIGETSGTMGKCLVDVVKMYTKKHDITKKVKSATIYPMLVLAILGVLLLLGSMFLIPHFRTMFDDSMQLPKLTEVVFFIADHIPLFTLIVVISLIVLKFIRKIVPVVDIAIKRLQHRLILKVPVIKTAATTLYMYYTASTLGLMIKNGIRIKDSLELTRQAVNNYVIQEELKQVSELIVRGTTLSEALDKQPHFDGILVSIVATGEESGKMSESLQEVTEFYSKELDSQINTLMEYVQPVSILLIGLIVAPVVIAIYLPVFEMSTGGGLM